MSAGVAWGGGVLREGAAALMVVLLKMLLVALFGGIVAVTAWGWRAIPNDRRFPVSLGVPPSVDGTVAKTTGLLVWPAIGIVLCAGSLLAGENLIRVIAAFLLAYFLAIESYTVRRLAR